MPNPDQIPYVKLLKGIEPPDEIEDVPLIGNLFGVANAVVDFAESDCNPNWSVYARTLFPALGEAVLVLLSFDLYDVLRGYFRPAGGRGFGGLGRASRRPRRLTRAQRARGLLQGGIPELGDEIGKRLPGATIVKGRQIGVREAWFWKVDGVAQRGLYYWMIADVLEDFTINWTTAIMNSPECGHTQAAGFERTGAPTVFAGTGAWTGVLRAVVTESWGGVSGNNNGVVIPPGWSGTVLWEGTAERFAIGTTGTMWLRLRDANTDNVLSMSSPVTVSDGNLSAPLSCAAHVSGPADVRWELLVTGDFARLAEGIAHGFLSPL